MRRLDKIWDISWDDTNARLSSCLEFFQNKMTRNFFILNSQCWVQASGKYLTLPLPGRAGRSLPSESLLVLTEPQQPAGPPLNIVARAVSSTHLLVTWSPPVQELRNGDVQGYNLGFLESSRWELLYCHGRFITKELSLQKQVYTWYLTNWCKNVRVLSV